ncbi:MAG: hypothetical protein FJ290_21000 [Planctomycetes bacterium]|nr:hypothetical protein [Planctomycetota bacterium]
MSGLVGLDWLAIGLYFALIAGVAWWSARRQETSSDYFLASRNIGWFVIGGSLFATNIGSERELVRVGRVATAALVLLGIAWIPLMKGVSKSLYVYLQTVQAYLGPPITAVFFLGVFWRRINAAGALAGLLTGFILGMAKLGAQLITGVESLAPQLHPWLLAFGKFNFLYFCLVLFGVSVTVVVVVSLLTPRPDAAKLNGLTYATISPESRAEARRSWNAWDVVHSLIILAVIAAVYLYFTG